MRLKISRSKNAASLYVIKSTYQNGVHSTKIVEKLGTLGIQSVVFDPCGNVPASGDFMRFGITVIGRAAFKHVGDINALPAF